MLLLEPQVFGDDRGFFMESWSVRTFRRATGLDVEFVQDNHSRSVKHVLRCIHYQVVKSQGKLARVVNGAVFDVAVDLRRASTNFGSWVATELTAENRRQLWVPPGLGHAFLVVSDAAEVLYKAALFWISEYDRSLKWNDSSVAIDWPLD